MDAAVAQLLQFENGSSRSSKYLFRLDGEPERDLDCTVESLKQVVAEQATELARWRRLGNQFNAAVASLALGTGDIGLPNGGANLAPSAHNSNRVRQHARRCCPNCDIRN